MNLFHLHFRNREGSGKIGEVFRKGKKPFGELKERERERDKKATFTNSLKILKGKLKKPILMSKINFQPTLQKESFVSLMSP